MNTKDKVEAYVRSQIPELMELSFGCEVYTGRISPRQTVLDVDEKGVMVRSTANGLIQDYKFKKMTEFEIIGHPIQPHHWLKVLSKGGSNWTMQVSGSGSIEFVDMTDYNTPKFKNKYLILGHENFYKALADILNIEV